MLHQGRKTAVVVLSMMSLVAAGVGGLAASSSAPGPAKADKHVRPFTATVRPERDRVRINQAFPVTVRVVNSSKEPQSFRVANGSWETHWKSNNDRVRWVPKAVFRNFIETVKLEPGRAYEKTGSLFITPGPALTEVVFKLGFTPEGSKETYWSDEVRLPVEAR